MRAWAWVGLMLLGLAGGCGSALDDVPLNDATAFRRCWAAVQPNFCTGGVMPYQCRNDSEVRYRNASHRARVAWLEQWGCPRAMIENR